MVPRRKTLLVSLVDLLWAGDLLAAYWWFEIRYIRPFSEQTILSSGSSLRLPTELVGSGPIRLVYFWGPACPRNVGSQQYLDELIGRFASEDVGFYILQKPGSQGRPLGNLATLRSPAGLPSSEQLSTSLAVAIQNCDGRLAYSGPYSKGAVCTSSNNFIEPILEALLQGRPVGAIHTLAVGCYCPQFPEKS